MQINFDQHRRQRGALLFMILLAVVLFAALSYAVTQSLRSGGKDGSSEKAQSKATEIIQYATLLEQTAMRLKLVNGCTDDQLSAEVNGFFINNSSPSDKRCHFFDSNGGAMAYGGDPFPTIALNNEGWSYRGTRQIRDVGILCASPNPCTEIVTGVAVTRGVCIAINAGLGIVAPPADGDIPIETGILTQGDGLTGNTAFDGNTFGGVNSVFKGLRSGCYNFRMGTNDSCTGAHCGYYYYHVLVAR